MSSVQVFFTSTPQEVINFGDPISLRDSLRAMSLDSAGIQFSDFEQSLSSSERGKLLQVSIDNKLSLWSFQHNAWDFHGFRSRPFDFSKAVISWTMICSIQVGSDSRQILYRSTQTFADFKQAILSSVLVKKLISPVIEVKTETTTTSITTTSGSSSTVLFTEELFKQRIVRNQLVVRSEHALYSQLKTHDVLPKFEYTQHINLNINQGSENALFDTLTSIPDPDFATRVRDFAYIMLEVNRDTPFGLFLGLEYLRFVRSSFADSPGIIIDSNGAQRRTTCDSLIHTLSAILSRKVCQEIHVWPQKVPKHATGHGPLEYYLSGPVAIVVHQTHLRDREDEVEQKDQRRDEREENPFRTGGDVMVNYGKKTSSGKALERSLVQVLAQALDTMREGSLPDLYRKGTARENRCFCVLSTGQRYYFFRMDWDGKAMPRVTYLGLYRFPSRHETNPTSSNNSSKLSSPKLEESDASVTEYVDVLAAFLVCVLNGNNEASLRSLLLEAGERYKAFTSTGRKLFMVV